MSIVEKASVVNPLKSPNNTKPNRYITYPDISLWAIAYMTSCFCCCRCVQQNPQRVTWSVILQNNKRNKKEKISNEEKREKKWKGLFRRQTLETNEIRHTSTHTSEIHINPKKIGDNTVSISLQPICDSANARFHEIDVNAGLNGKDIKRKWEEGTKKK